MNLNFQADFLSFGPQLATVFTFAVGGFALAFGLTPLFTYFAYRYRWWKKARTEAVTGEKAPVYAKIHAAKARNPVPTMAGILIWGSVALITFFFNFTREQTYLPLFALASMGVLGLFDDIVNITGKGGGKAGIPAFLKLFWLVLISGAGAWWFFYKLGFSTIHIPAGGNLELGWLYIPLFILVIISTANAVNITDGLDGLAGGLLTQAFGAYAIIAFFQGNLGIAAFCATILGALLSYTWFNIYPARFIMGDTGALALGAALGVVAMLTDSVLLLPIIGLVLVAETGSSILQILSKKLFGRKIFLSAPLHHHLEAVGWPEPKITMRFWVIGAISAVIGTIAGLLGRG